MSEARDRKELAEALQQMWAAGSGAAIRVAPDGTVATVTSGINPAADGVGLAAGADGRCG